MIEQPIVRVGQVWADNDKRSAGREVKVLRFWSRPATMRERRSGRADDVQYAVCQVARDNWGRLAPFTVGRCVDIRVDRFRPTSTGYRLVKDAPA